MLLCYIYSKSKRQKSLNHLFHTQKYPANICCINLLQTPAQERKLTSGAPGGSVS